MPSIPSPYSGFPHRIQTRLFWLSFGLTLLVIVVMQTTGLPLITEAAPMGILSFEMAGEMPAAQAMVDSWDSDAQVFAGLNMGFDYLFLLLYALTIGLGCVLVGNKLAVRYSLLGTIGGWLAWGMILAALLDAVENYALIGILIKTAPDYFPAIAKWCAIPKFLLVVAGLFYLVAGFVLNAISRK